MHSTDQKQQMKQMTSEWAWIKTKLALHGSIAQNQYKLLCNLNSICFCSWTFLHQESSLLFHALVLCQYSIFYNILFIIFISFALFFPFKMSFHPITGVSPLSNTLTNGKLFVSICEHYTLLNCGPPGVSTGTSSIFFIYAPTWSHDTETQHLSPLLCGWYTAVSPINALWASVVILKRFINKANHKSH